MPQFGFVAWSIVFIEPTLRLGGIVLQGETEDVEIEEPGGATHFRMGNGQTVSQSRWTEPDKPLSMQPISARVGIDADFEVDMEALSRANAAGAPLAVLIGDWRADRWSIPGQPGGTTWTTSRYLPHDGVTRLVNSGTYAVSARVDGVAQTVITTGSPASGEVLVPPAPDGALATITTPAYVGGELELELYYQALYLMSLRSFRKSASGPDDLSMTLVFEEALP